MMELSCDPVIRVYLQMVRKTQSDFRLPEYSEIYIRLAVKEINGKTCEISEDVLKLYRKLLVLYYCENYPSLTPVITIMERCFTKEEIYNIINDKKYLLGKWLEFQSDNIVKRETEKATMYSLEESQLTKKIKLETFE